MDLHRDHPLVVGRVVQSIRGMVFPVGSGTASIPIRGFPAIPTAPAIRVIFQHDRAVPVGVPVAPIRACRVVKMGTRKLVSFQCGRLIRRTQTWGFPRLLVSRFLRLTRLRVRCGLRSRVFLRFLKVRRWCWLRSSAALVIGVNTISW
jgi:hypothetical protein